MSETQTRRTSRRRTFKLSVAAVAVVAVLAATGVALGQGTGRFWDVPSTHYAYDSVRWATVNSITQGCGNGESFCPEVMLNRAHAVTFLHRYHNNVASPELAALSGRIDRLEEALGRGGTAGTQTTPTTPVRDGTGFGTEPTPTTVPPRKYTTNGRENTVRSFTLAAGTYDAVFSLEAVKAADDANEDLDPTTEGDQNAVLIRVEYRDSSNQWKTYAVRELKLPSEAAVGTVLLPGTGDNLLRRVPSGTATTPVVVENVPGSLPTSGSLRVSVYTADPPNEGNRTTKYRFDWGLVLTEQRK